MLAEKNKTKQKTSVKERGGIWAKSWKMDNHHVEMGAEGEFYQREWHEAKRVKK